jgi:hypothetical protein
MGKRTIVSLDLRVGSSAQTANSGSGGNNPEKAVATFPSRATGCDVGNITGPGKLGPGLEIVEALFDSSRPGRSGGLAGEALAAILENHPTYPNLRKRRHRALFGRLDAIVVAHVASLAGILRGFGFDEAGARVYGAAALRAFRSVLPN